MDITVTVNGKPETDEERWERIKREVSIRKRFNSQLEQAQEDFEDGVEWKIKEVRKQIDAALAADRKRNGVVITIRE